MDGTETGTAIPTSIDNDGRLTWIHNTNLSDKNEGVDPIGKTENKESNDIAHGKS